MRRNFSSRARLLSGGDAIVVSIPKSGRTWVRAFLAAYFCSTHGREMTLEPERYGDPSIPRIVYTHDRFEQRTKGSRWDNLRGKYLIPPRELQRARIILLARDPRDAFVSLHVQLTRRTKETPSALKRKSSSELLRDPAFGIRSIVQVMNAWLAEFSRLPKFTFVRYETLRANPADFRALLASLGHADLDEAAYQHALAFSAFANMKKLEAAGAFDSKILQAGDVADPESFKVRRGKVGGFRDYLSAADQGYAAEAVAALDSRFGYQA